MPATITGQGAAASTATTTSIIVTLSPAPVVGEKLIAVVGHSDDYPVLPSGWTQDAESALTGVTRIFSKTATGTEGTSFTFTAPTAGAMSARVMRVTGLGAVDAAGSNGASGTNSFLFASVATTAATTWVLAGVEAHATTPPSADFTWTNSFVAVAADVKSPSGTKQSQLGVAAYSPTAAGSYTTVASYAPTASPTNAQGAIVAYALSAATLAVSAGADQSIFNGQTASVSATASGGSGTKTYAWTVASGPSGTFSSGTSATAVFTPTGGVGTYVLRCTVTDTSGSAFDELTLTVNAPATVATYATLTGTTGWTATGGTLQVVLSDTSDATYMTSSDSPSSLLFDGTLQAMVAPTTGQDVVVTVRAQSTYASSASVVARLYNGATLVATSAAGVITGTMADVALTFTAADLAAMPATAWPSGVRLTLSFTAAA